MHSILMLAALAADPSLVHRDYAEAYRDAAAAKKMLVVDFATDSNLPELQRQAGTSHVLCQLPLDATLTIDDKAVRLLDHDSFSEVGKEGGVAIVDLENEEFSGSVVSALPRRHVRDDYVVALLGLPKGTLTQRSLTWAFRVHPERPQSAWATVCPMLMNHAANHSQAQANSGAIYHNLPGMASSEIVAESWPWNNHPIDAAIDIVQSWRGSPGHWQAASSQWGFFGYDMKHNGSKWFATGVFR